jgi:hypothetical protein
MDPEIEDLITSARAQMDQRSAAVLDSMKNCDAWGELLHGAFQCMDDLVDERGCCSHEAIALMLEQVSLLLMHRGEG